MAKSLGTLIKEARMAAGLSQKTLADQIPGLSASDIGRAERGEKEPTKEQIRQIAKACGVTQASLLAAVSGGTGSAKTSSAKTSSGKTSAKTSSAKTSSAKAGKSSSLTLTATEKKLVELYREADSDTKKAVMKLLKGEQSETSEMLSQLLSTAMTALQKKQ